MCTLKCANHSIGIEKMSGYDKLLYILSKEVRCETRMLGGSFWIAVLRNSIGAGLMMTVFLLLDHPRLSMKKTIWYYAIFGLLVVLVFSFWYWLDSGSFVRFAGMLSIPVVGSFCVAMSRDTLYLSLYKLALGFYLLSVIVFCGIDAARICFAGNLWADIIIRFLLMTIIFWVFAKKVRKGFLAGVDFLREEMDIFSAITVFMSILVASLVAFWPGTHVFSMFHIVRTAILLFMAGLIQYMVFQVYLHRGKERRYQIEKELLETNERLIRRQLELMQESKEELARIRHDARHHCLLIEEYIRNGEQDKLLAYVKQYKEDMDSKETECICGNEAINSILSVYARRARKQGIEVTMHVKVPGDISIRDIDLVAVLANIFENAIHGCLSSGKPKWQINISITRKGNKMVVQCRNTCATDVVLKNGVPESHKGEGIGISSVLKVASYYNGEAEFAVEKGMFIARILLNLEKTITEKRG